ncbi:tellurite methyltransferase [bacterium BMS3Abin04]|nr:tellurite methyltransferase [bacterium BMS3Abin04]
MIEDKIKWNKRFREMNFPDQPSKVVVEYSSIAKGKKALDIAAGMGRNSKFLAQQGFEVDALELSDVGIEKLRKIGNVNAYQVELDNYTLPQNNYDLIICLNYLNRKLFSQIKKALKTGGVLIYETLCITEEEARAIQNPDYFLRPNELRNSFNELNIIYYKEYERINNFDKRVTKASLVGEKI